DARFSAVHEQIQAETGGSGRRRIGSADYQARGVLYLPEEARFQRLLNLTEGDNIGEALRLAMHAIEEHNPELRDVLPKTYGRLDNRTLIELLRLLSTIPMDIEGD